MNLWRHISSAIATPDMLSSEDSHIRTIRLAMLSGVDLEHKDGERTKGFTAYSDYVTHYQTRLNAAIKLESDR